MKKEALGKHLNVIIKLRYDEERRIIFVRTPSFGMNMVPVWIHATTIRTDLAIEMNKPMQAISEVTFEAYEDNVFVGNMNLAAMLAWIQEEKQIVMCELKDLE